MKKENLVFHTVLALVLTLTIISLSVVFTLAFRPLYYLDISALGIAVYGLLKIVLFHLIT